MRWVVIGLSTLMFTGCGAKYRPQGPVMSDYERSLNFPVYRGFSQVRYEGDKPKSKAPPLPFLAFGAAFDLDIALMPKSDEFDMIEVVRLARPDGPLWLALETNLEGDQTIVASVDNIEAIMPELPLARVSVDRFNAEDASDAETVDVSLSYINSLGRQVEAKFEGDAPVIIEKKRNGRTFDHSANQLLAVLDIPSQESLFKADVKIGGSDVNFRKVSGVVPGRFVQTQAQGGIAVANFRVMPTTAANGGADYGMAFLKDMSGNDVDTAPVEISPSDSVRITIAENFSTIQGCYLKRAEDDATLGGPLQVDVNIDEGVVIAVAMPEIEGGIADEAMQACVRRAVDSWSFDDAVTGTVNWTFGFTAAEGEDGEPSADLGSGTSELEGEAEEAPAADMDDLDDFELDETPDEDLAEDAEGEMAEEEAMDDDYQGLRPELSLKNFETIHKLPSGNEITLNWLVSRRGDQVEAVQTTPERTLTYTYRLVSEAYLELVNIRVEQYGRGTPVTAITFNPPIPDIRWGSFGGKRVSDFVIDVNGQQNHSVGQIETSMGQTGPRLVVKPSAPKWTEDRALMTTMLFTNDDDGSVNVTTERITLDN